MSRFDKKMDRALFETDPKLVLKAIEYYKEVCDVLKEAISHYSDLEKLNDAKYVWYQNAKDSYENKLEKVSEILVQLEARYVSLQAGPVAN
jgi:hypothetical protein